MKVLEITELEQIEFSGTDPACWCAFVPRRSRLLSRRDAGCAHSSGAPHQASHVTREPVPVLHWMVSAAAAAFLLFSLCVCICHLKQEKTKIHDDLVCRSCCSFPTFLWDSQGCFAALKRIITFSVFRCPFWWRTVFGSRGYTWHSVSSVKQEEALDSNMCPLKSGTVQSLWERYFLCYCCRMIWFSSGMF